MIDHDDVDTRIEASPSPQKKRKRRRGDEEDDLEDRYMQKLIQEPDRGPAFKREKSGLASDVAPAINGTAVVDAESEGQSDTDDKSVTETNKDTEGDEATGESAEDNETWVPPKHETETTASTELEKAGRTVFLGNVSVTAITNKSARKTLDKHLTSFIETKKEPIEGTTAKILETIRFRSTPYSPALPKKAAFARKEVVTATTQSTNAYAVYASPALARQAVQKLNATIVLDRHLRVDSVAHPAPIEHKRCVFIGNLGFVDDESNIVAANEADGHEKRKTKQKPSDVEEGLWRLFAKHGSVESVRVVRDKGTRVGKGFAYVQFSDENAVESALSEDGKKDPPMLPRRLRVTRAKAIKRKAAKASVGDGRDKRTEYRRKVSAAESTQKGRIGKLMGKAAASLATQPSGFKPPESFVFEGHRARADQGKTGLKLVSKKRKGKPTNRSARRAAAFKAGDKK